MDSRKTRGFGKAVDEMALDGKILARIALCGLLLSSVSGCLGLGLATMPANTVVLSSTAPVVDESVSERQPARGTDPATQLARSAALTTRWRRERPVNFGELDRPTGAPMPGAVPSGAVPPGAAKLGATTSEVPVSGAARLGAPGADVEMRAAAPGPAPRGARDPAVDAVTALDRLESRAKSAARSICDHC